MKDKTVCLGKWTKKKTPHLASLQTTSFSLFFPFPLAHEKWNSRGLHDHASRPPYLFTKNQYSQAQDALCQPENSFISLHPSKLVALNFRTKKIKEFQAQIHTGFHRFMEIGQILHNKYIFSGKWFGYFFFQFPGIRNNKHWFVRLIIQGKCNWPISCPETQVPVSQTL